MEIKKEKNKNDTVWSYVLLCTVYGWDMTSAMLSLSFVLDMFGFATHVYVLLRRKENWNSVIVVNLSVSFSYVGHNNHKTILKRERRIKIMRMYRDGKEIEWLCELCDFDNWISKI